MWASRPPEAPRLFLFMLSVHSTFDLISQLVYLMSDYLRPVSGAAYQLRGSLRYIMLPLLLPHIHRLHSGIHQLNIYVTIIYTSQKLLL